MKTLKIAFIALLGLSLATVSCKKEAAPEQQQQTNNNGGNGNGNGSGNSTDTTNNNANDSLITFVDLLDNIGLDSTIVYDSTYFAANNYIEFGNNVDPGPDYSSITIRTLNNGGMTNNELMTSGTYSDRLSGIIIYNEAISAFDEYTLVTSSTHFLSLDLSVAGQEAAAIQGTFVNTNGDTVVIPFIVLKYQ